MKRSLLAVAVLATLLALAPSAHATESPAAHAVTAGSADATPLAFLAAVPAGGCSAWHKSAPEVESDARTIEWPGPPQGAPCWKCFSLGMNCCGTVNGTTCCD